MESEEYALGRSAYEDGKPRHHNPYSTATIEGADWDRGWRVAERDDLLDLVDAVKATPDRTSDMLSLNQRARDCHKANAKWWHDAQGNKLERNKGELLMLMVSEISECMEGERKNLMDDKLPWRKMAEVELADALIRIFDYAGAYGYDLDGAYNEKREYNRTRADHTHEARAAAGGKKW